MATPKPAPTPETSRRRGLLPAADSELRDVAMRVAAAWKNSKLTLRWINPEQFEQAVVELAVLIDTRQSLGEERRPLTEALHRLDREINRHLIHVKHYLAEAYGTEAAPGYYEEFGIQRQGKTWALPIDRTERLQSLDRLIAAFGRHKLGQHRYGTDFWRGLQQQYLETLAEAESTDQNLAARVADKNSLRTEIKKVLHALYLLIQANYPDTWEQELKNWGFGTTKNS